MCLLSCVNVGILFACRFCEEGHYVSMAPWRAEFLTQLQDLAVGRNQWDPFWCGAPPVSEPILVGIGMFTGGYDLDFDPWPFRGSGSTTSKTVRMMCGPSMPDAAPEMTTRCLEPSFCGTRVAHSENMKPSGIHSSAGSTRPGE